ncbi:MAG: alpha/beta hydrolase [Naasia sp.]
MTDARRGSASRHVATGIGDAVLEMRARRSVDGRPTLLIHGAAGSARTWDDLLATPAATTATGMIASIDLPGWGASTSRLPRDATLADMRRSVLACLDVLERETGAAGPWQLVGHSMGGLLALDVAAAAPDRVAAVIAVSPSASGVIRSVTDPWASLLGGRRAGGLPALVLLTGGLRLFAGLDRFSPALMMVLERIGVLRLLTLPLFRHPFQVPRRVVRRLGLELRPHSFAAATRSVARYDLEQWTAIRAAVTTIEGDRDVFVGEEDARAVRRTIPQSTRIVESDCGHFPHVERAGAVASIVWPTR